MREVGVDVSSGGLWPAECEEGTGVCAQGRRRGDSPGAENSLDFHFIAEDSEACTGHVTCPAAAPEVGARTLFS